jgi:hypothetical protein
MTGNNGWSGKPGVPLNPEQSGCHWVTHPADEQNGNGKMAVYWNGLGYWFLPGVAWKLKSVEMEKYKYHDPALTPAEVDARIAAARKDAQEKCISICNAVAHANRVEYPAKWKDRPEGIPHEWQQAWETCAETAEDIAADIRALAKGEGDE